MPPFFDVNGDPNMDPYTILSLPATASDAEIKKAYRMQMLQLHPDKLSPTLGEESIAAVTEKFHNVKDAYEFLMSPLHLTSRRLYMAKMASRRAEYERREAYLRRHGGSSNYAAYSTSGVRGYARGGGGAAGMAGTGMPGSSAHHYKNQNGSYAMPSKNSNRSKSEPRGGEKDPPHRRRGTGAGQPRHYRSSGGQQQQTRGRTGGWHNSHHNTRRKDRAAAGRERNGYKSEGYKSGPEKANKSSAREEGRSHRHRSGKSSTRRDGSKERHGRQRTTSEPRRRRDNNVKDWETEEKERKARERKSREEERHRKAKSRRARSAPARYSSRTTGGRSSNLKFGSSSSANLPKEYFCPLTKRVMKDPVRDEEGNTYEREAIERWLRVQSSSPITNTYLSLELLRPDKELKRKIYKATGRSKSQTRTKSRRSESPARDELNSGRVLIDSYLREISSKSKLSVALDGMGICAFSYRRITFVIEVPITPHAGFMVYSSFDGDVDTYKLSEKTDAWNNWLGNIGRHSRVSSVKAGQKTVFTLKGSERDMTRCEMFQKTLEFFVEMSLKLHNLLHPMETKTVANVCLTRTPVPVA